LNTTNQNFSLLDDFSASISSLETGQTKQMRENKYEKANSEKVPEILE
jgi:hypothetical protein